MAKQSHPYAAGRISVMERGLLGKSGLDRLLATQTVDEFYRALAELGWGDAYSQSDVEKSLLTELQRHTNSCVKTPQSQKSRTVFSSSMMFTI